MDDPKSKQDFDRAGCIFCKIISGDLPSSTLYETNTVIALLDINPVRPGHTLIAPKEHHETALETPDALLADILTAAKYLAPALTEAVGAEGFNLSFNNGAAAGQVVAHTHLHVIPRQHNDGLSLWKQNPYPEGEQEKLAKKIQEVLAT